MSAASFRFHGKLERFLSHRRAWAAERRLVLTRDRELLKRRDMFHGYYVHALKPEDQLREVAQHYSMQPFTLCLHCNLPLESAIPEALLKQISERIRLQYHRFRRCAGCERIYWEGSHWDRMRNVLAIALDVPISDMR